MYVTPTITVCSQRCGYSDAIPEPIVDETTKPLCKHCGSPNLIAWTDDFKKDGKTFWHCITCSEDCHV